MIGYARSLLNKEDYDIVGVVDRGEGAIEQSKLLRPDIILMDIMLNGNLSGCEAAVEIHYLHLPCKVIFLTAYAEREMVEYATEAKAYAYLMKPYREQEILATIKMALLEENLLEDVVDEQVVVLKNHFSFDHKQKLLYHRDQEIPLTSKKLKLIELLAKNKNHIVSNEEIALHVWGELKSNSTLRSLIHRFRSVINDDIISNMNGVGYCIETH